MRRNLDKDYLGNQLRANLNLIQRLVSTTAYMTAVSQHNI